MKRLFFLLSICFVLSLFSKPLDVQIDAKAAIVINAKSNRILFEKNAHEKLCPASITKVASIIYTLEKHSQDLEAYCLASSKAIKVITPERKRSYKGPKYVLETDGAHFDLIENEKLKLDTLLHGMMVCSGNDASNVVAESVEGSIEAFIKNLNVFLKGIGCENTNFCNPHGLYVSDHKTTAYDLSLITKYAIQNPKFLDLFSCKYFIRPKTNKQSKKEKITYIQLLKPGKNYYKYAIGGKTGYVAKAGYCLASLAKKNDRSLIVIVLGCKKNNQRYQDTIKLYEAAFKEKKISQSLIEKDKIFSAKIKGAAKTLKAKLKEDLIVDFYPSEETPLKAFLVWDDIKAPIKKGQKVGKMKIIDSDNKIVKNANVYALNDIRRTFFCWLKGS